MSEISDLMGIDPLKLTREDRSKIIEVFRENRHKFMQTGPTRGRAPAKSSEEKAAAKEATKGIKLDDLELDL